MGTVPVVHAKKSDPHSGRFFCTMGRVPNDFLGVHGNDSFVKLLLA